VLSGHLLSTGAVEAPRQLTSWSNSMQENISLACPVCKRRNYTTTKNKKTNTEKLERSKYCRFCRKHTAHKEGKV
jgi:large subunit ribosomal protein L33